jgi:hypothetical protein
VSYFLLPHARRVASPPWVLDRRRLRHLRRRVTCARRAVTALACTVRPESGDRSGVGRAAPSRAAQAEASPASAGHALRTRAAHAVHVGQAASVSVGHTCTVHLGRAWFRPSGSRFKFSIF